MKYSIFFILTATLHCADSIIESEAKKLTDLWTNGSFIPLDISKGASLDSLVQAYQNAYQEANPEWKECTVLDHKSIIIPQFDGQEYLAVLIKHTNGNAVIYFRYNDQTKYWWNKSYPVR